MICRQRAFVRRQISRKLVEQRKAHDDALMRGLRLHEGDAFLNDAVGVDRNEAQFELARLDFRQIEQRR